MGSDLTIDTWQTELPTKWIIPSTTYLTTETCSFQNKARRNTRNSMCLLALHGAQLEERQAQNGLEERSGGLVDTDRRMETLKYAAPPGSAIEK
jgi:hypothetical protein